MASTTYPGVYVVEQESSSHPITGVTTSTTAFVGYTASGIDGRAELIFSFSDYERLFGGLAADSELSYAVQQYFLNGGSQAYVVRTKRHGATAAQVTFGGLTFTALSSGSLANGAILLDVDYAGVDQQLPGTVTIANDSATVTGSLAAFKSNLAVNDWLIFSVDPSQTPYQVSAITDDNTLTLAAAYSHTAAAGAGTAIFTADPTTFNLTITNRNDGSIESFPLLSLDNNRANFIAAVLNDPDTGSQLVNVAVGSPAPTSRPAQTGLVGKPISAASLIGSLGTESLLTGTVTVTGASVTGSTATFTSQIAAGQWIVFGDDTTKTPQQIASITDGTRFTLKSAYTGAPVTNGAVSLVAPVTSADFDIVFGVTSPSTPPTPLPITVTILPSGATIPQTVSGMASQLQKALSTALAIKLPGAAVVCSVAGSGAGQSIRVNATIPQYPDAVLSLAPNPLPATDPVGLFSPSANNINVSHYTLGTGNGTSDTWDANAYLTSSTPGSNGSGLPQTNDLIGDPILSTGIYALNSVDIFNLLCIPDATRALPGDPKTLDPTVSPNDIYSAAIALCHTKRAFLLIDPPPFVNTVLAAVDWKTSGLTVNDTSGACFFPRLRIQDPLNAGVLRTFAPCGVVAGIYARIDSTRGVWKAPAGTEASLTGVSSLIYRLTDDENGALNPLGLNCFRTFPIYGTVLWGARTLAGADAQASSWKYVPVRRTALFLEQSLYQGTQWVVFELNDEPLWAAIRLNIGSFMNGLFRKGAFQGAKPSDAYFVKCDSETTTQADIDNGIVNILVGFAPLKPAEFVVIQIQQMTGSLPA
jgi:phage tail sheath protein FI